MYKIVAKFVKDGEAIFKFIVKNQSLLSTTYHLTDNVKEATFFNGNQVEDLVTDFNNQRDDITFFTLDTGVMYDDVRKEFVNDVG
jgi:hypothetical protein